MLNYYFDLEPSFGTSNLVCLASIVIIAKAVDIVGSLDFIVLKTNEARYANVVLKNQHCAIHDYFLATIAIRDDVATTAIVVNVKIELITTL